MVTLVHYDGSAREVTEATFTRRLQGCIMVSMMSETNKPEWPDLQKDHRAVEQAVEEQRRGLIGTDPVSLLRRAQEIKEAL